MHAETLHQNLHQFQAEENARNAAIDKAFSGTEPQNGPFKGVKIQKSFGLIPGFKSKDELLEEEFDKFVADYRPEEAEAIPALKNYFKAYVSSDQIRQIIENQQLTDLATNPTFSTRDFKAVPAKYRTLIPNYIKDYVSLNRFMP